MFSKNDNIPINNPNFHFLNLSGIENCHKRNTYIGNNGFQN